MIYTDSPRHRAGRPNRTTGCKGVHLWQCHGGRLIPRISFSLWCDESGERHLVHVLCHRWTALEDAVTAARTVQAAADRGKIRNGAELALVVASMKCWLRARKNGSDKCRICKKGLRKANNRQ